MIRCFPTCRLKRYPCKWRIQLVLNRRNFISKSRFLWLKIQRLSQLNSELDPTAKYSLSENWIILPRTSFHSRTNVSRFVFPSTMVTKPIWLHVKDNGPEQYLFHNLLSSEKTPKGSVSIRISYLVIGVFTFGSFL